MLFQDSQILINMFPIIWVIHDLFELFHRGLKVHILLIFSDFFSLLWHNWLLPVYFYIKRLIKIIIEILIYNNKNICRRKTVQNIWSIQKHEVIITDIFSINTNCDRGFSNMWKLVTWMFCRDTDKPVMFRAWTCILDGLQFYSNDYNNRLCLTLRHLLHLPPRL